MSSEINNNLPQDKDSRIAQLERIIVIETALEKVRASTMEMHKSNDLVKVATSMNAQLKKLGFHQAITTGFGLIDEAKRLQYMWGAQTDTKLLEFFTMPLFGDEVLKNRFDAWKRQDPVFSSVLNAVELKEHLEVTMPTNQLTDAENESKGAMPNPSYFYFSNFRQGYLHIIATDALSAEQQNTFARFARVFEQAYTRFLDIKKAEEQAKEAQIEAALERIRNRTLLMRDSSELNEAVAIFFQQFKSLGLLPGEARAFFGHINKEKPVIQAWMTRMDGTVMSGSHFTPLDTPSMLNFHDAWKNQIPILIRNYEGVALNKYLNFVASLPHVQKDKDYQQLFRSNPERIVMTDAFFLQGSINIMTFEPLSQDAQDMLVRFAKVFEFTYTRFLDLQKAEAQAREAKIEAALERVRASTMAMHHSSDLTSSAGVLLEQVQFLGAKVLSSGFVLCDENNPVDEQWMYAGGINNIVQQYIPHEDEPIHHNMFKAWQSGAEMLTQKVEGKAMGNMVEFLMAQPSVKANLENIADAGIPFPDIQILHSVNFSNGYLLIITVEEFPEKEIFIRFANVFEQTYTRFLDLQKAEAQAREAKIEAALERVRAKAMSMHKSEDLADVLNVIFEQMHLLGFDSYHTIFGLIDLDKKVIEFWSQGLGEFQFPFKFEMPIIDNYVHNQGIADWQSGKAFSIIEVAGKTKRAYDDALFNSRDLANLPETVKNNIRAMEKAYFSQAFTQHGSLYANGPTPLPEEQQSILVRFAKVLDLTYTRMLDLQKAENQARELEIVFQENERLLHSILPMSIAEQLKKSPQTIVKRFESVSILFADIVGFTILSDKLSPQKVVDILNGLFSKFDDLTDKYQLEKIKTIGDAYMVASGVPEEKENHALALFQFAQEMLEAIQTFNQVHNLTLAIRIGISSGPVVAGVIGKKKFAYDLWGDTVNTAARMEAYGQASCIQLAPPSYELLKDDFEFEKIPNVEIKGKGEMDMYLWKD